MNTVFEISAPLRSSQTAPASPVQVKTRGFSGTMTYTMSQHPTNMYIIPLKKNFAEFKEKMHEYSVKCFLCETMPQMSNQMTLVSKSFENFIEVANQFYQGVNLSPRGRTNLHTSALQKAARPLVENWMDFIHIMNDVFKRGMEQFYTLIPKYYKNLQRDLDITIASFDEYSYKTDVPAGSIRKLKMEVSKLKVMGQRLCKQCNESKRKEMESGAYLEKAQRFIDRIYKFFNVSVPKQTITSGSVFKVRTKVYTSCGELADVITGAQNFAPLSQGVKESIINFNDGLEDLLNKMEFPFCIKLDIEDENTESQRVKSRGAAQQEDEYEYEDDDGYDDVPLSPEKQIAGDHIDKLQNQLKDIDAKIDTAQEMLKGRTSSQEEKIEKDTQEREPTTQVVLPGETEKQDENNQQNHEEEDKKEGVVERSLENKEEKQPEEEINEEQIAHEVESKEENEDQEGEEKKSSEEVDVQEEIHHSDNEELKHEDDDKKSKSSKSSSSSSSSSQSDDNKEDANEEPNEKKDKVESGEEAVAHESDEHKEETNNE